MRRAKPHRVRMSHAQPQNKMGLGGRVRRAGGRPPRAPPTRDPPLEPSELSEAVARTGVLSDSIQKNEKYTLSLKLSKKQLFILWLHGQRDQA